MKKKTLLFILLLIVLFIASFAITSIVIKLIDKGYNYEGKSGSYRIDVDKIENITIYSAHVKRHNIEYIYRFRNKPEDLETIYLEEELIKKLNRPRGLNILYVTRDKDLGNKTNDDVLIAAEAFEAVLGTNDYGMYQIRIRNAYTT